MITAGSFRVAEKFTEQEISSAFLTSTVYVPLASVAAVVTGELT